MRRETVTIDCDRRASVIRVILVPAHALSREGDLNVGHEQLTRRRARNRCALTTRRAHFECVRQPRYLRIDCDRRPEALRPHLAAGLPFVSISAKRVGAAALRRVQLTMLGSREQRSLTTFFVTQSTNCRGTEMTVGI